MKPVKIGVGNEQQVRCLSVPANFFPTSTEIGVYSQVVTQDCANEENSYQDWTLQLDGTLHLYPRVFSPAMNGWNAGVCLNAVSDASDSKVNAAFCNNSANQQWRFDRRGSLKNTASGKCLSAPPDSWNVNGSEMVLQDCDLKAPEQVFPLQAQWGPLRVGSMCVNMPNDWQGDGYVLEAFDCNSTHAQWFWYDKNHNMIVGDYNGWKNQQNTGGRWCASSTGSTALGTEIVERACNVLDLSQRWILKPDGEFQHPASGLCLGVKDGIAKGNHLDLQTCDL
ncbi:ricin-type beta-trefoil lectin domain protein [Streptomyces sp. NPDC005533]|uniref:RICIN domain-containing protein n=1 Tax=Streptomyces sp. NPDC005533 TaxID=3364723 RepID=UPI0036B1B576